MDRDEEIVVVQPCCVTWARAQQPGTDNESYGCLIGWQDVGHYAGHIEEPMKFCPWCGAEKRVGA